MDQLVVTVLDDGTVKIESPGEVSPANHASADGLLRAIAQELGGVTTRERVGRARTHGHADESDHVHEHEHEHEHGGH